MSTISSLPRMRPALSRAFLGTCQCCISWREAGIGRPGEQGQRHTAPEERQQEKQEAAAARTSLLPGPPLVLEVHRACVPPGHYVRLLYFT